MKQLPKIWNYAECFTCADLYPYATRNQFNSKIAFLFAKEEISCSHVLDLDQVHVHFGLHAQMMCFEQFASTILPLHIIMVSPFPAYPKTSTLKSRTQNQRPFCQNKYSNALQKNSVSLPSQFQNKYSNYLQNNDAFLRRNCHVSVGNLALSKRIVL